MIWALYEHTHPNNSKRQVSLTSPFYRWTREVWRGNVNCPKSYGEQVVNLGWYRGQFDWSRVCDPEHDTHFQLLNEHQHIQKVATRLLFWWCKGGLFRMRKLFLEAILAPVGLLSYYPCCVPGASGT